MCHVAHEKDARSSPLREIDLVAVRFEREWRRAIARGSPTILTMWPQSFGWGSWSSSSAWIWSTGAVRRFRSLSTITFASFPNWNNFRRLTELTSCLISDSTATIPGTKEPTCHQRTDSAPDVPLLIGRFPIAGRLGSGGQADVFLSFHPELSVPVVLKWQRTQEPSDTTQPGGPDTRRAYPGRVGGAPQPGAGSMSWGFMMAARSWSWSKCRDTRWIIIPRVSD